MESPQSQIEIMLPEFVDSHCHLDLYPDLEEAIAKCDEHKTATLAVTTTPKAFSRNLQFSNKSEFVRVALGLHPQLVEERVGELGLFKRLLLETRYVGEIGLDASPHHYRSFELQKQVFRTILDLCANAGGKILSVHSVRAATQVLNLIEELFPDDRGKVVLHWFTGSASEVRRAIDLGCFFSLNERMLNTLNGKRIVQVIPDNRLLTETDGPFLKRAGISIDPGDVELSLKKLAKLKGTSFQTVRSQVVLNYLALID